MEAEFGTLGWGGDKYTKQQRFCFIFPLCFIDLFLLTGWHSLVVYCPETDQAWNMTSLLCPILPLGTIELLEQQLACSGLDPPPPNQI